MAQEKIKKGMQVSLKSGGPIMTIAKLEGGRAHCVWFDNREVKTYVFDPDVLRFAEDQQLEDHADD